MLSTSTPVGRRGISGDTVLPGAIFLMGARMLRGTTNPEHIDDVTSDRSTVRNLDTVYPPGRNGDPHITGRDSTHASIRVGLKQGQGSCVTPPFRSCKPEHAQATFVLINHYSP